MAKHLQRLTKPPQFADSSHKRLVVHAEKGLFEDVDTYVIVSMQSLNIIIIHSSGLGNFAVLFAIMAPRHSDCLIPPSMPLVDGKPYVERFDVVVEEFKEWLKI